MRYKENKAAAQAKPATMHVKKDGTPDKRYKENKNSINPKRTSARLTFFMPDGSSQTEELLGIMQNLYYLV